MMSLNKQKQSYSHALQVTPVQLNVIGGQHGRHDVTNVTPAIYFQPR
jgi:hypothetical protein